MFNNSGINKAFLVGVIAKEPRWHKNAQVQDMLCFTLITKEDIRKNNTSVEHIETHTIRMPAAQYPAQGLRKGQLVHVEGKIQTQCTVDEQQVRRYKTEILANRVFAMSPETDYADLLNL